MQKTILVALVLLGVVLCSPPVPKTPEGYLYKPAPDAKVRLDIYEDLFCGDCRDFDPPFKQFLNSEFQGKPYYNFIEVYVHNYILPIHVNTFKAVQINPWLWDKYHNGTLNAAFNEWCFQHQDEFFGEKGDELNQNQVVDKICSMTDGLFGYTEAECQQMYKDETYRLTIHYEQKFGAYYRVYTTPGVFLNGIQLDDIPATSDEWKKFIKPYLE